MKKALSLLIATALLITAMAACQREAPTEAETPPLPRAEASAMTGKLKVLTERFYWGYTAEQAWKNKGSPLYTVINQVAKYMMGQYPGLEIEVETLTVNLDQRDQEVQQRRVALMAGDVPDIFLLPTHSECEIYYEPKEFLFRDVEQAMGNSWFTDISGLYNGDADLHTEELNQTIMDAGTLGSARYILPLWYSFPVIYARKDMIESSGIDWEAMGKGTKELNQAVVDLYEKTGDPAWSTYYSVYHDLDLLPKLCDYEREEVLLDSQAIVDFMMDLGTQDEVYHAQWKKYEQVEEETGEYPAHVVSLDSFLSGLYNYCLDELGATASVPLKDAFEVVPAGKALGYEIEMTPLRSSDNKLNAQVTYWGAVSSACEKPEAAYEFLRFFLTPTVQYGEKIDKFNMAVHEASGGSKPPIDCSVGPMPGWPVRYKGFAEKQWARHLENIENTHYSSPNPQKVLAVTIDDSDFPILDEPIDGVRFPSALDMEFRSACLSGGDVNLEPEASFQKMANEFIRNVKYHLAEG